ncbi:MAG: TrmH family RNA methyltransferase, partial [Chloroflexota bacterium]
HKLCFNLSMTSASFQIRICLSCGLRYPLVEEHPFGTRCPACLGSTEVAATHPLRTENLIPFNDLTPGPLSSPQGAPARRGELAALLDNIRSAWNVGSIFRTADGFGLPHLHLCGITPTPAMDALKKTALSAESTVSWSYHKNALAAAQELKAGGCRLLALEESERAIPIHDANLGNKKAILIAGNEVTGVDPGILEICDQILYIPMRGGKKSFNVAVAFAVAVSQLTL